MTTAANLYQRMAIGRLQELAATEGEHQDEAARAYVDRLADMELERRLVMRHNRPGWHKCSPGFGDGTGKSTVAADPLAEDYDRGNIENSYWHDRARKALGKIPKRNLSALLIRTAKADYRTSGPFSATYDDVAKSIHHYLQMLDWPPGARSLDWFKNGQSIKKAAHSGRIELLLMSKVGVL